MMKPVSPYRQSLRQLLRRLDYLAGELNVLLLVVAIGLATLDATFLLTQKVVEHLPPVTHASYDAAPSASP